MNKFFTFVLLATLFVMPSCADDEEPGVEIDNLVGQWKITAASCDDGSISLDGGATSIGTFTQFARELDYTINFLENGTFISNGDIVFEATVSAFGLENTTDIVQENWLGAGTWERSENSLITNTDGDEDVTTSEILMETDNIIELTADLIQDAEIQGFNTTNSCTLFYTLTKEE